MPVLSQINSAGDYPSTSMVCVIAGGGSSFFSEVHYCFNLLYFNLQYLKHCSLADSQKALCYKYLDYKH